MNPKRKSELCHLLVVLSNLTLEVLDELKPTTPEAIEHKELLSKKCEEINDALIGIPELKTTNYFSDLANKVYTVIRKNYKKDLIV